MEKGHSGDPEINTKIIRRHDVRCGLNLTGSRYGSVADLCVPGGESLVS
jgi:hypothetical protein